MFFNDYIFIYLVLIIFIGIENIVVIKSLIMLFIKCSSKSFFIIFFEILKVRILKIELKI